MLFRTCRLLFSALVLLLASEAVTYAETVTWRKQTYATDGFEVEFSGAVKVTPTKLNAETAKKIVRSTDYLQDGGSRAYIVSASIVKGELNFDEGVKGNRDSLKCKKTTSDTPLNLAGGRGREVRGEGCVDGTIVAEGRYFVKGKAFYQVVFLITDASDLESGRHFLRSFKIIGK